MIEAVRAEWGGDDESLRKDPTRVSGSLLTKPDALMWRPRDEAEVEWSAETNLLYRSRSRREEEMGTPAAVRRGREATRERGA